MSTPNQRRVEQLLQETKHKEENPPSLVDQLLEAVAPPKKEEIKIPAGCTLLQAGVKRLIRINPDYIKYGRLPIYFVIEGNQEFGCNEVEVQGWCCGVAGEVRTGFGCSVSSTRTVRMSTTAAVLIKKH